MLLDWQIDYLLFLQNFREMTHDFFTPFFLYITSCGEYLISFVLCSAVYWCKDKRLGTLLVLNGTAALMLNHLLKSFICIQRPWILDARVKPVEAALRYAGGYSFPSGHSTIAVSCWGTLAFWYRKHIKFLCLMILLCLTIAFSRNYLGVHTIQDVAVGLITGTIILYGTYKLLKWVEEKQGRDLWFVIAFSLMNICIAFYSYYKSYPMEFDVVNQIFVENLHSKYEVFSKLGLFFGGFWGWFLERRLIRFNPQYGTIKHKLLRMTVGLLLLFCLVVFLRPFIVFYLGHVYGDFTVAFLLGLFITAVYPWLVKQIQKNAVC